MNISFITWAGYQLAPCKGTVEVGDCEEYVWNGTGPQDIYGDWAHSGHGIEATEAKHSGSRGLKVQGYNNVNLSFVNNSFVDISRYTILLFWINVQRWDSSAEFTLDFTDKAIEEIDLSIFVQNNNFNTWQSVFIPLDNFTFAEENDGSILVRKIRFKSKGRIDFYLDDIYLTFGAVKALPICSPEITSMEVGSKALQAMEFVPSMKVIKFPGPTNL